MNNEQATEHERIILAHFNRVADQYDLYAFLPNSVRTQLIERFAFLKQQPDKVLDIGAGTGQSIHELAGLYPKAKLYMLDNAAAMLKQARKQQSLMQLFCRQIDFQHGSLQHNNLSGRQMDLIMANLLLPYITDLDVALQSIQALIRPGGVFGFSSFGPDTMQELQIIMRDVDASSSGFGFGHLVDMHILGDALLRNGFQEPVMDVDLLTLTYADFDSLWTELFTTGLIYGELDSSQYEQIAKMYEKFKDQDGQLPVTFEVVYGQAWGNSSQEWPISLAKERAGVEHSFPLDGLKIRNVD